MCLNGYGATSQPTREQLEEALTEIKGLFELLIETIFFFFLNVSSKWTKVFILNSFSQLTLTESCLAK